jgi:transposase-like protein
MSRAIPRRSRPRRAREDIERLVHAYDTSGLTQVAFARKHRLSVATLRYWLCRRRDEHGSNNRAPALIPVTLRPAIAGVAARIEVALVNGRELRAPIDTDPARLAALVSALDT